MAWLGQVNEELTRCAEVDGLEGPITAVRKATEALGASAMHLGGLAAGGQVAPAMLHSVPFLNQFGNVALAHQTLIQARIATERLAAGPDEGDARFYRAKILNAHFYCANILPESIALGRVIRSGDASCLDTSIF